MKNEKQKKRRSNQKVMKKEAQILKFMRESRNLSMRRAGALLNLSDSTITHILNGRADLHPKIILKPLANLWLQLRSIYLYAK